MNNVRALGIGTRVVGLFLLQVLGACAAPSDGPPSESGIEQAEPSAPSVNPQRNPELWTRPALPPEGMPEPPGGASPDDPGTGTPGPIFVPKPPTTTMPFRGINLAGGEFGSAIPGKYGTDYTFPTHAEVDYYRAKGMTTFRVGFLWERLQPKAKGELDAKYFALLDDVVKYATAAGAWVVLNPHNFARYYGDVVGSSKVPSEVFANFWGRLSARYKLNTRVMFNLVNEPHDMPTEQWVDAANAAIASIRAAGANNTIVVPGNAWTGAHAWKKSDYGTPNSVALLDIEDPVDNVIFEAHQYLDGDSGGSSTTCVSATIGSERLAPFVDWLRANKKKGMLGEFAGAGNPTCSAAIKDMMQTIQASSDVLVGWLWWAGGPWWGDYMFTLEPKNGADRPQMAWLTPYLKK